MIINIYYKHYALERKNNGLIVIIYIANLIYMYMHVIYITNNIILLESHSKNDIIILINILNVDS